MKTINKFILICVAVFALASVLPALLAAFPILILIAFTFGWSKLWRLPKRLWSAVTDVVSFIAKVTAGIFSGFISAFGWLAGGRNKTNRFMGTWQKWQLLGGHQDGFLVDGHRKRISEKSGYESLLIQGGMGRGKSSTFVMPNLLNLPKHQPSFVITDTSGEVYRNTAGYLESQGYTIKTLDLMDLKKSETYNPLATCHTPQDIAELAKILVSTANQKNGHKPGGDPFWQQAAEKLIRILAQCLHNQPNPQFRNLANLRHLITSFDAHVAPKGQLGKIDQFVLSATHNDPVTFASYQAFVQGNLKTIQSVLMSADVALDPLAIPEIATLTATNSIQFSDLRQSKTALYILVNQTQMPFFAFLLNLFYTNLFKSLLVNHNNPGRPVWMFLEEFGHLTVKDFETYGYGAINAKTILESIGTEIYLPGVALDTARNLEARMGRRKNGLLMPANEIIRMKQNEALMLQSNHLPVKLKTKRFYEQGLLKRRSSVLRQSSPLKTIVPPNFIAI